MPEVDEALENLIGMMRDQGAKNNPPSICTGKVISGEPIEIKTGDLILYRDNLLMSDLLLGDYTRECAFDLDGTVSEAIGKLTFNTYLKVGDTIVLMPTEDEQIYIALCKVV